MPRWKQVPCKICGDTVVSNAEKPRCTRCKEFYYRQVEAGVAPRNRVERNGKLAIKYWYFFTVHECLVCGDQETTKEKRYSKKPDAHDDRYQYIPSFDGCIER